MDIQRIAPGAAFSASSISRSRKNSARNAGSAYASLSCAVTGNLIDEDICLRRPPTWTKRAAERRISPGRARAQRSRDEEMEFGNTYRSATDEIGAGFAHLRVQIRFADTLSPALARY